jgi:hypothetical protein
MPSLVKVRSFLRNLFCSGRAEKDLHQEVDSYIEMLADENLRAGVPLDEAQRAARIELGGITLDAMGPLHVYSIARRIATSCNLTKAPSTPRLSASSEALDFRRVGASENNRKAKCYSITRFGIEAACRGSRELGACLGRNRPRPAARAALRPPR